MSLTKYAFKIVNVRQIYIAMEKKATFNIYVYVSITSPITKNSLFL